VGASDDLNKGLSTFMVEMIETSNILHHATSRSLIILDEIGRGTSTYDGIAIASAVAEFLVSKKELSPKTLFATHYFELTKLEKRFEEIKNYHVAIHEKGDEIIFLRKIVEGILDKSFGIHVAKLAGIPATVIQRAKNLLKELEEEKPKKSDRKEEQFTFFDQKPFSKAALLKDQLDQLDINTLSAKQALDYLYQLKEDLKEP
jgi:DNA mismatch repair protein MutS